MLVELQDVDKHFGRVHALRAVSLQLPSGSRTALIGPNGSGKSTLVRALMGMLAVRGAIRFDGEIASEERAALARRIAYVPQIAPRLAAPVRDVVAAVAGLRGRAPGEVATVAARLGLDLADIGRRPFRALSGGQRQKVLAALAIVSGAELLLLDEPTASMDPASRGEFFALVEELPSIVTVVLCSHRLDEVRRLVDHVIVLEEGVVAWQGAAAAYIEDHAEAVVEVQADGAEADAWLLAKGFARGNAGWWSRSLPVNERARLLGEIGRSLNGQLRDVMARDVERLQPRPTEELP
ncbi:MAG: ATP-binding cassette domain-containing protein [Planctomycetes bacterium]|nr:ATP-binding cassette domain-containing protein [Planctomycetota bacterium]